MKEVTDILGVVQRTAAYHKYRIMATLTLKSNVDRVQYAVKHHMV